MTINNRFARSALRPALLAGAAIALSAVSGQAAAQTAPEPQDEEATQVDEIVVTGTRRSLEDALATKRRSTNIIDSISSEGIGRLPDLNLAESLQRVPGVQISRSAVRRQGTVNIRGLPGDFSQTLLNGQYLASPTVSNFAYGTVRSEVFSGIDVIKAQGADSPTGGLSGLVNLRTGAPLSGGDSLNFSVDQAYEELTEEWSPGAAVTVSRQFVPGVFGVRGAIGYKSNNFRTDNAQISTYDRIAGAATPNDNADDILRPREVRLPNQRVDGESLSASFGAEWRPTEQFKAELFGFYNNYQTETDQNEFLIQVLPNATTPANGSIVTALSPTSNGGAFGGTISNIRVVNPQINVDTRLIDETFETAALTGRLSWTDDVWTISGTLHYTEATYAGYNYGYSTIQRVAPGGNGFTVDINTGSGRVEDFSFNLTPGASNLVSLTQAFGPLVSPAFREARVVGNANRSFLGGFRNNDETEDELAVSFDIARTLDWGPLSAVKFGGVYRDKSQEQDQSLQTLIGADLTQLNNSYYGWSIFDGGAPYMDGRVNFDIGDYGQLDVRALRDLFTPVTGALPAGNYFVGPGGVVAFRDSTALSAIYQNEQTITGGYLMVDFEQQLTDLINLRGNLGVRYEKSERDTMVVVPTPRTLSFEYDNTLPSANLVFEIAEDWVVRGSYGQTLRRPQVDSFAILRSLAVDGTGQIVTINISDGELLPFTSTNLDLSVEWYNRAGSSFSAILFNKEVEDYAGVSRICPADGADYGIGPLSTSSGVCRAVNETPATPTLPRVLAGATVNVNVTANQDTFTLSGFELSAQQNLDFLPAPWNGFGGQINYTNIEFESDSSFRLGEISEHTLNAIVYYETDRFGLRAAYNYRSEYFLGSAGTQTGADRMVKARPQLDISGSWNITDRLAASFEAFNVTDEELIEYEGVESRVRNYFVYGRTFTVGLRWRL